MLIVSVFDDRHQVPDFVVAVDVIEDSSDDIFGAQVELLTQIAKELNAECARNRFLDEILLEKFGIRDLG